MMKKKGTLGFTAKAVSDRIKSKGLQKLKWYCQMCEKQCQNANEFKLHSMSDDHERQMQMYIQNPSLIKEIYSHKFEKAFLEHLRCHYPSSPVAATVVYDEMIIFECNRRDVNLSSTKWTSLAEFVRDLGVTGKCVVKGTPQGWFVSCNNVVDSEGLKKGSVEEDGMVRSGNCNEVAFVLGSSSK